MAHFYRLTIGLLAFCFATLANALLPLPQPVTEYSVSSAAWSADRSTACHSAYSVRAAALSTNSNASYSFIGVVGNSCQWNEGNKSTGYTWVVSNGFTTRTVAGTCPENSTQVSSGCQCVAKYHEESGACVKDPIVCPEGYEDDGTENCVPKKCTAEQIRINSICTDLKKCDPGYTRVNGECKKNKCEAGKEAGIHMLSADATEYFCSTEFMYGVEGCQVRVNSSFGVTYTDSSGKVVTEYSGMGKFTGATCNGGSSSSGSAGGSGSGGTGGTGGGTGGTGGEGTGTGGTGGTGGSGGGTGGGTGTGSGGSGSGTGSGSGGTGTGGSGGGSGGPAPGVTKPNPSNPEPDGSCKSGFVKGGDGMCYSNIPKAPDGDGKCEQGYVKTGATCTPLVPTGKGDGEDDGGGMFAGQCEAGFSCEGDAIQCAIAKEQHVRSCQMFENKSDESKAYDGIKDKKASDVIKDLPGGEEVDIGAVLDRSDALGGGSCLTDLSVTVFTSNVVLPISQICPYMAMLGNILVALSMLGATVIIVRG